MRQGRWKRWWTSDRGRSALQILLVVAIAVGSAVALVVAQLPTGRAMDDRGSNLR